MDGTADEEFKLEMNTHLIRWPSASRRRQFTIPKIPEFAQLVAVNHTGFSDGSAKTSFKDSTHLKLVSSTGRKTGVLTGACRRHRKITEPKNDFFMATRFSEALLNKSSHCACQMRKSNKLTAVRRQLFLLFLYCLSTNSCLINTIVLHPHLDYSFPKGSSKSGSTNISKSWLGNQS